MADTEIVKTSLRTHMGTLLIPHISDGFWSIQSAASELCTRNGTPDQVIRTFQNMLTKIPEWSDITLSTEVERIQKITKCSYFDDLLMGVFISYMKSFASLQQSSSDEISIEFDRPTLAKFVHEIYTQSARKLWQVAYLFKTAGVSPEMQSRARQEVETIIDQCLEQVIHNFLPWESITKKYFGTSVPVPAEPEPEPIVEEKKSVSFGEVDEEEEEVPPPLTITEEEATLDVEEEEVDPMKELERKAEETLVLNL